MSIVYFVIPCYNEEQVLPETVKRLTVKLGSMIESGIASPESRMLFVDDGSRDKTWELIEGYHRENPLVGGVKLAHNRGHQNALLAGLMTARKYADCAISLDADLQDDIEVLDQFVRQFQDGCDVVYGVRSKRETDTFFKRNTALAFYRVMKTLGVDLVYNHADYRLMSRRALDALADYRETNLFLRGIVPLIGFRSGTVTYERHERFAGESKYPLKKMISFARRHHLVQRQAPEDHRKPGCAGFRSEYSWPVVRPHLLLYRQRRSGLDGHCLLHLAARRHPAALHRRFGRLHRENLQ